MVLLGTSADAIDALIGPQVHPPLQLPDRRAVPLRTDGERSGRLDKVEEAIAEMGGGAW